MTIVVRGRHCLPRPSDADVCGGCQRWSRPEIPVRGRSADGGMRRMSDALHDRVLRVLRHRPAPGSPRPGASVRGVRACARSRVCRTAAGLGTPGPPRRDAARVDTDGFARVRARQRELTVPEAFDRPAEQAPTPRARTGTAGPGVLRRPPTALDAPPAAGLAGRRDAACAHRGRSGAVGRSAPAPPALVRDGLPVSGRVAGCRSRPWGWPELTVDTAPGAAVRRAPARLAQDAHRPSRPGRRPPGHRPSPGGRRHGDRRHRHPGHGTPQAAGATDAAP